MKLVEVLSVAPGQVFNETKARHELRQPRKMLREEGRLNPNKFYNYQGGEQRVIPMEELERIQVDPARLS